MPPLPLPLLVSTPEADLGDGRQGEWRVREGVSRLRDKDKITDGLSYVDFMSNRTFSHADIFTSHL